MADIVIVGGGVSGLSAGIFACLNGHKATILEKNAHPGGNLTGWTRQGCTIDNCIHWLTGTNPSSKLYHLWKALGALGDVEIIQKDSLFTVGTTDNQLTLWRDISRLERELYEKFPSDKRMIGRFISAVRALEALSGVGGDNNDHRSNKEIVKGIPSLLYFFKRSADDVASKVSDPLLKSFFTALTGGDFSSLGLLFAVSEFCSGNGGIPRGGSKAMAERMADKFSSLGGVLKTNSAVSSIVGGDRPCVKLFNGEQITCDYVIIATEPTDVFGICLPKGFEKLENNRRYMRFSAVQAAYLCDIDVLPFSGMFIMNTSDPGMLCIREFSHEPDFAPESGHLIQVMLLCDKALCEHWIDLQKNKEKYSAAKAEFSRRIISIIETRFPTLCGKLECIDVWTPATYKKWTGGITGSFMAFTLPKNTYPKPLSPNAPNAKHVLWASQWMRSPGGLPYAALSGKAAVEAIPK